MFVVAHFLIALAKVLSIAIKLYIFVIILYAISSWFVLDPYNPLIRFLRSASEPVLYRMRRILPLVWGGVDFSPFVLLLILYFALQFIVPVLYDIGMRLK